MEQPNGFHADQVDTIIKNLGLYSGLGSALGSGYRNGVLLTWTLLPGSTPTDTMRCDISLMEESQRRAKR